MNILFRYIVNYLLINNVDAKVSCGSRDKNELKNGLLWSNLYKKRVLYMDEK